MIYLSTFYFRHVIKQYKALKFYCEKFAQMFCNSNSGGRCCLLYCNYWSLCHIVTLSRRESARRRRWLDFQFPDISCRCRIRLVIDVTRLYLVYVQFLLAFLFSFLLFNYVQTVYRY